MDIKDKKEMDKKEFNRYKHFLSGTKEIIFRDNDGIIKGRPIIIKQKIDKTEAERIKKEFLEQGEIVKNYNHYLIPYTNTPNAYATQQSKYKKFLSVSPSIRLRNKTIKPGGSILERFGRKPKQPKSSKQRLLLGRLDDSKDAIVNKISDDEIIGTASRKDPDMFFRLTKDVDGKANKADAIRDFIKDKNVSTGTTERDKYRKGLLINFADKTGDIGNVENKILVGQNTIDELKSKYSRNKSSETKMLKRQSKELKRKYGAKGTPSRKIFERIKSEHEPRMSDIEADKYLQTEAGRNEYRNILHDEAAERRYNKSQLKSIAKKMHMKQIDVEPEKIKGNRTEPEQRREFASVIGYKSTAAGSNELVKHLVNKMKQTDAGREALLRGDEEEIYRNRPKNISYGEIVSVTKGKPAVQTLRKIQDSGIEISGLPSEAEQKLAGTFNYNTSSGQGRGRPSGSSGGGHVSSGSRGRTVYSKGGSWLGGEEVAYSGGNVVLRKKQGKISMALSSAGGKIKGKFTPSKRDRKKLYEKIKDDKRYNYLTDEEKKFAAYANPAQRRTILARGRKMYRDPAYRAKIKAKQEQKKGIYEAKLAGAVKESQRRQKAATSPFWRAWYTLTHNLWVLIGVALTLAILFLPVGMFYVLGWAIAVGIVSLVMFVIWVFIELWWMIAQGLVAFINLVSQAIIGVMNYVGGAIAGALGQEFTPFQHILVQNMHIVERGPNGERIILGITWGEWNLVPPDFLKLNEFMPTTFDTDTIIVKLWPALRSFFHWYTQPIADRYTEWISTAPWYTVGAIIGIPIVLIIIGVTAYALYIRRKLY